METQAKPPSPSACYSPELMSLEGTATAKCSFLNKFNTGAPLSLPQLEDQNGLVRQEAERKALNY